MCEYEKCTNKPTNEIFNIKLCKIHYIIVMDNFNYLKFGAGRIRKIRMDSMLKWIEEEKLKVITPFKIMQKFIVTHTTAYCYLKMMEKHEILAKDGRNRWKVMI